MTFRFLNFDLSGAFLFMIFCSACTHGPAAAHSSLRGMDTFGSQRLSATSLQKDYGPQIESLVAHLDRQEYEEFKRTSLKVEGAIKAKFNFAYVKISLIQYFDPQPGSYVTVDVVEPADVAKRMSFLPQPQGTFADPDGLIALWDQYMQKGVELLQAGKLEIPQTCPVWHCLYGFENPQLAPFFAPFNLLVPLHEKELVQILQQDSRAQFRENAAMLLAHLKNGKTLVKDMLSITRDSVGGVRNNATRVLWSVAQNHPEIKIPVEPLLEVLNFPDATDRNKASFALAPLALKKENQKVIVQSAGRLLIDMLKLKQPNNREGAYMILMNLSDEKFGEQDVQAWEAWLLNHGMRLN